MVENYDSEIFVCWFDSALFVFLKGLEGTELFFGKVWRSVGLV